MLAEQLGKQIHWKVYRSQPKGNCSHTKGNDELYPFFDSFEACVNFLKTLLVQVSTCRTDCDRILTVFTTLGLSSSVRNLIPGGFSLAAPKSSSITFRYKSTKLVQPTEPPMGLLRLKTCLCCTAKPARMMVNAMMDTVTMNAVTIDAVMMDVVTMASITSIYTTIQGSQPSVQDKTEERKEVIAYRKPRSSSNHYDPFKPGSARDALRRGNLQREVKLLQKYGKSPIGRVSHLSTVLDLHCYNKATSRRIAFGFYFSSKVHCADPSQTSPSFQVCSNRIIPVFFQ